MFVFWKKNVEFFHKHVRQLQFYYLLANINLDKVSLLLSHYAPFDENYAKLYFDAKHVKTRLIWGR